MVLPKPNYQFEKRQREIAKKKEKDAKLAKKRSVKTDEGGEVGGARPVGKSG